jgi:hypothetical protein
MFARLDEAYDTWGLCDQDYIHNGKKLINPITSLQLDEYICKHIG